MALPKHSSLNIRAHKDHLLFLGFFLQHLGLSLISFELLKACFAVVHDIFSLSLFFPVFSWVICCSNKVSPFLRLFFLLTILWLTLWLIAGGQHWIEMNKEFVCKHNYIPSNYVKISALFQWYMHWYIFFSVLTFKRSCRYYDWNKNVIM